MKTFARLAARAVAALVVVVATVGLVACEAPVEGATEETGTTDEALQTVPWQCPGPSSFGSDRFESGLNALGCYYKQNMYQVGNTDTESRASCPAGASAKVYCPNATTAKSMTLDAFVSCWSKTAPYSASKSAVDSCTGRPMGSGWVEVDYDPHCTGTGCSASM